MPKLDSPLLLSPVFKPKIWGREDLRPIFASCGTVGATERAAQSGEAPPRVDPDKINLIGEAWLTDDASQFMSGPLAGMTLGEASQKYGPELHGTAWKNPRFPILAKYIFTSDWLSVQVHPDDGYARIHEPGNLGKCEMWYIVRRDRVGEILLGLKFGTSKQELRVACGKGTASKLLNSFTPQAGEAIFVPPGTVHALGPGLVLFEAEQNSDLTYRLDDFGRHGLDGKPRPLHLEKGMDVIRPDQPIHRRLPRLEIREPYGSRRYVLACPHFAVEELTLRKPVSFQGSPERVEVLSILAGQGRLENLTGWLAYRTGEIWVIPPGAGPYRLFPREKTRVLKFYVPDLDKDFRRPLAKRRVSAAQASKIIFN